MTTGPNAVATSEWVQDNPSMVMVRLAAVEDAARLGQIHVVTWRRAYSGLVPEDYLDSLDEATSSRRWTEGLSTGGGEGRWFDRSSVVHVAADEHEVIQGFIAVGTLRDAADGEAHLGEVRALYVDPAAWDNGYGRALLAAGQAALVERGFGVAALWVLESNARARRFYEKAGWTATEWVRVDERIGPPLSEVRYERELGSRHRV